MTLTFFFLILNKFNELKKYSSRIFFFLIEMKRKEKEKGEQFDLIFIIHQIEMNVTLGTLSCLRSKFT